MARQALSGLTLAYPHKVDHLWLRSDGPLPSPEALHPVFYGSYDWHSSVHSHWCLVRLLRRFPGHIDAKAVEEALRQGISVEGCLAEAAYFARPGAKTFERPYGWGWLLMLAGECALAERESADADAGSAAHHELFASMSAALEPIANVIRQGWLDYLPKLAFPVRSGVHSNTAFGLLLSHCYGSARGDTALLEAINSAATRLFGSDVGYNPSFEPSGEDFLSPGLCEMALMRRVLPTAEAFTEWATGFMPSLLLQPGGQSAEPTAQQPCILSIPTILDRTDARLVHLDGLLLSKAWALRACAESLEACLEAQAEGEGEGGGASLASVVIAMREAADAHYEAAAWDTDSYVGSHWLHSFALLALDGEPQ